MKESYKEGDSDSILALSLAGDIARCRSKRRQGYRWAGLLSFEKHPRWEPYAVMPLVRFCAGGDQRWSSLPRPLVLFTRVEWIRNILLSKRQSRHCEH